MHMSKCAYYSHVCNMLQYLYRPYAFVSKFYNLNSMQQINLTNYMIIVTPQSYILYVILLFMS